MNLPTATIKIEIVASEYDEAAVDLALNEYAGSRAIPCYIGLKPEIRDPLCDLVEQFLQQHGVEAHVNAF